MTSDSNWLHFNSHQPKRKRAELVCLTCHAKKIKCNIQLRKSQGHNDCSNCSTSGRECRIRPSKREKRRKGARHDGEQHITGPTNEDEFLIGNPIGNDNPVDNTVRISNGVDALLAADATFQVASGALERPQQTMPAAVRNIDVPNFHHNPSPQNTFQIQDHSPAQSHKPSTNHTDTTPTQVGDVDSGFLQVYGPENQHDADNQALVAQLEHKYSSQMHPDLEQIFTETYFEYCYTWCPVLEQATLSEDIARSPLLANALALAASHIQPPLLPHEGPEAYYKKARTIFYDDEEADSLTSLKALCLFYWWAPLSPSRVHRHSSWWWTSVIIRHAQQMGIHREPGIEHPNRAALDLSLRRKIWWTAFARERLTALCQSKPIIIDPDDCNIAEPTLLDFGGDARSQRQGEIFIHWVRLCAIIGRIAKFLLQPEKATTSAFPNQLREELVNWVHSLPPRLQLRIDASRTQSFDRDVHQLHLFYLTTIVILHLKRSSGHLPQALPPAILAASCTARILKDILARGNSRFLMAITCWHVGTASIALLQACRIQHLSSFANEDLDILQHTVKQLQTMWASANVIASGIERLRRPESIIALAAQNQNDSSASNNLQSDDAAFRLGAISMANHDDEDNDFDWMRFFPFVTKSTNGIAASLISGREQGTATRGFPSPNNELFHDTLLAQYQDLFDPFTDYAMAFTDIPLHH
ncbi:hypothetical protein BU24DRAFT_425106 [Aaosphaeria arxii CBS 175.79]|uniref:Zn(2)-C6 fungal-type domain-containing protein n=1 Tax=Aaosphaeria arxii CBS 175.79 TaxID=1450172 RepID=A0A6A5XH81_9PLEO|nr:uncharacterized protein BU24DRAFT_425106 [Aaosphaeria arxii CBS 175.79]KAF2012452.1 hypothetical protein BU24DRAFT_425106 [Aaosphaeria arxii CBS 175.79]